MNYNTIDFEKTGFFSKTILDYIQQKPELSPFYSHQPTMQSFASAIEAKKKHPVDRQVLVNQLHHKYKEYNLTPSALTTNNIDSLAADNTYTVTTGHQLSIFGGPMYSIYKIITTINLAKKLKEEYPENNFVPVYWLASEDHDFEEVNNISVYGKKLIWNENTAGACGKINTNSIKPIIAELKNIIGNQTNAENLFTLLESCYGNDKNLSQATFEFIFNWMDEFGLIILEPNEKEFKKLFVPIIKKDILEQNSYTKITSTNKILEELGQEVQVNPREINFFYLDENIRERIVLEDSIYKVLNTEITFTEAELIQEIENNPDKFSPNVALRPVYQEIILPNLAYVGGPGESIYWLQLKSTFDFYKIPFPVIMLRNCALIIDEVSNKRLSNLEISLEDIFQDFNQLINDFVKNKSENELKLHEEKNQIQKLFSQLEEKVKGIDPTLVAVVSAEKTKTINSLGGLESKINKAEKRKFEIEISQIEKVKEKLFPNGSLQERHDNFIPYYLKYGKDFFRILSQHFDPFKNQFLILH